jgi:heterotetrameric sarcosine oxidase gamma subunit
MSEDDMSLITTSQLPLKSPIWSESSFEVPGIARLRDITPNLGVLHLRGPEAERTITRFSAGQPSQNLLATGEARSMEGGILCRLVDDEYLFLVETPEEWVSAYRRLDEVVTGQRATLSDLSHGYGKLELGGLGAAGMLARLCGLDFSEVGFPDGRVAQTSLAKVHATLVRMDGKGEPSRYYLLVDRSLSVYVWKVIRAVMEAFKAES